MGQHPFPYLATAAAKYGDDHLQIVNMQEKIVNALTVHDLAKLARVYTEIERRGDVQPVSDWIHAAFQTGWMPEHRQALMLLLLFKCLARRGVDPFARKTVRLLEREVALDWTNLPPDLRYLAGPAEKYGKYQFDNEVDEFFGSITREEYRELRLLQKKWKEDAMKINKFLDEHDMMKHKEAALVYFLLGVLDALDAYTLDFGEEQATD